MQSDKKGLPTAHSYLSFTLWIMSGGLMNELAAGFNLKACQESGGHQEGAMGSLGK